MILLKQISSFFFSKYTKKRHFLTLEDIYKTWKWKFCGIIITQSDQTVSFDFQQIKYSWVFWRDEKLRTNLCLICSLKPFCLILSLVLRQIRLLLWLSPKCKGERKKPTKKHNLLTFAVHFCRQCTQQEDKKCDGVHVKNYLKFPRCGRSWSIKLRQHHTNWWKHRFRNKRHQKTENDEKTASLNAVHLNLSQ